MMGGFTLVELLVVISIISLLMAILVPALHGVKRQATALQGMHNQREVAAGVSLYAMDNDDSYPQSVATIGFDGLWNWYDPAMMIGHRKRTPQLHRSMSTYLRPYIPEAKTLFCPSAPRQYTYLQEAWEAGDDWDHPLTEPPSDPFTGAYCFYWNYIGYLGQPRTLFRGPTGPASGGMYSGLLMSDYFGYGNWQRPEAFLSCEKLAGADIVEETWLEAARWSLDGDPDITLPNVKLRAAYTDGHVETYTPADTLPMRVPLTAEGVPPYADGPTSPGIFYIPRNALH
jgi:prepilin-type N-terminal cleavage/methylation domain-containing protein